MRILKFIKSVFPGRIFFYLLMLSIFMAIVGYFIPIFEIITKVCLMCVAIFTITDLILLYTFQNPVQIHREVPNRMSNGDDNEIKIYIKSAYPLGLKIRVIDELPFQFQVRDFSIESRITRKQEKIFRYLLKPVTRGEYEFGATHVYVFGPLQIFIRRITKKDNIVVPVYPSFIQMRKYELLASSNRLEEVGIKKIRRIGKQTEFEHIREYVTGDDHRTLNWKATARRDKLMVNQYQDERSQEVYCILDMGRVMKMPFEGMTLLDYAINASLVMANTALMKYDKAGLMTFSEKINAFLPAERHGRQMEKILETLYRADTSFLEPDYERMYVTIRRRINRRSLLILFTNFETQESLSRNIDAFKKLAANHLLLVVFFENTEIQSLLENKNYSLYGVYKSIIAEKLIYDKKLIVKELNRNGVHALLTKPANLSVNLINKYLEFKAHGLI